MQVCNMVSSGKRNCKCFIGYKNDDHIMNPIHTMLPKTGAQVKSYDGETK